MGGHQPAVQSAYARVDYVNGRMKDMESSLQAFRSDYRKLCTILSEMQKNLDERLKNCEARITVQDTAISSLQTMIAECSGSKQEEVKKPEPPKETVANWLHVQEIARICRNNFGTSIPVSDIARALVWAGILERKSALDDKGYLYFITKKNDGLNLVRQVGHNKKGFVINPEKIELLVGILREYQDWFGNSRRGE